MVEKSDGCGALCSYLRGRGVTMEGFGRARAYSAWRACWQTHGSTASPESAAIATARSAAAGAWSLSPGLLSLKHCCSSL